MDTFEIKERPKNEESGAPVSGVVTPYDVKENLRYPHILVKVGVITPKEAQLLQNMVQKNQMLDTEIPENAFQVYLEKEGVKFSSGYVVAQRLKLFLSNPVYLKYEKEMYLKEVGVTGIEEIVKVEGDLMYSYGMSSIL